MILALLLMLCVSAIANGQTTFQLSYIAEQMDEYCDVRGRTGTAGAHRPVGPAIAPRVGKAGPRGPPGVPGPAAEVDYSRIESLIDEKLGAIHDQMTQMKNEMTELKNRPGLCKVEYRGKCFWAAAIRVENLERALEVCKSLGGKGANIYNATHFEMLRKYLITLFSNDQTVYTGMSYKGSTLTFSDGTQSTWAKWFPGYPTQGSTNTAINFNVYSDPTTPYSAIWNYAPSYSRKGVICEI